MHLYGMKIVETQDPVRYKELPEDVQVTPAFRKEFNEWAKSFFLPIPEQNIVKDGQMIRTGNTVYVNPRTFAQIKAAV